jgi:hypothetical protein
MGQIVRASTATKQKTAIYLLVSVILALSGFLLLAAYSGETSVAIATSLIAGGISSGAFAVIRYFDDVDVTVHQEVITRSIAALDENISRLDSGLDVMRSTALLAGGPDQRRVFEKHPKSAVQQEIRTVQRRDIDIDALGMSLQPIYDDIVRDLLSRENAHVRLLVQDPRASTFSEICLEQGRDRNKTASSILYTIRKVLEHQSTAREGAEASIEIRCFGGVPSVTLTRVNRVIFVRPRYPNEANFGGAVFYERYDERIERACYETYCHYFEAVWESGRTPTVEDLGLPDMAGVD